MVIQRSWRYSVQIVGVAALLLLLGALSLMPFPRVLAQAGGMVHNHPAGSNQPMTGTMAMSDTLPMGPDHMGHMMTMMGAMMQMMGQMQNHQAAGMGMMGGHSPPTGTMPPVMGEQMQMMGRMMELMGQMMQMQSGRDQGMMGGGHMDPGHMARMMGQMHGKMGAGMGMMEHMTGTMPMGMMDMSQMMAFHRLHRMMHMMAHVGMMEMCMAMMGQMGGAMPMTGTMPMGMMGPMTSTMAASGAPSAGQPKATASGQPQTAEIGAITVKVTPLNLKEAGAETVDFTVALDTHTVNLDFDLAQLATLQIGEQKIAASVWEPAGGGGHHVAGTLRFPATAADGEALLEGATELVLVLRGLPGDGEQTFTWRLAE
jgi:hypothetical protein